MANITYRVSITPAVPGLTTAKGVPLTNLEVDGNFKSVNNAIVSTDAVINHATSGLATRVSRAGDTLTGSLNWAPIQTLASATTVNIGGALSNILHISGITTISAFDNIAASGIERTVTFLGSLTLTHSAVSLILPGGTNIITVAGDTATFVSQGMGNWRCVSYNRSSGGSVGVLAVASGGTGGTSQSTAQLSLGVPSTSGTGATGTWGINISGNASGNAGTVTNGVYNNGATYNISVNGNAATAGGAAILLGSESDWASYRTRSVANMLSWKNYGSGHIIFDASASTSPTGSSVNNTNAAIAWSGAYPTLMGWNGSSTYGVRVDSARASDTATTAVNLNGGSVNCTSAVLSGALTVGNGQTSSDIFMVDTNEGTRRIHCNSNRIGFLTQADGWGAWCEDNGDWTSVGNVTAYSDGRLKKDLSRIENSLDKIDSLVGYTYTRTDTGRRETGLIAQDIQKVLPEAVMDGEYLSVAYGNMMGLVVESIKELRLELKALRKEISLK